MTPCKAIPAKTNKWYLRKEAGGYSPCIPGSPEYCPGSVLDNCVGWSWGRFAEMHDDKDCKIGCYPGNNFPGNAYAWIEYSRKQGFEIGTTPVLGAVAVWIVNSGKWGHVANVEEIYSDGSWLSSESGYDSFAFKNKKYPKSAYRAGYKFLGFVLPKYEFYIEEKPEPKPDPSNFKIGDKVIISGNLYYSSYAASPSGYINRKVTTITRYNPGSKHPYNTTGDLGWMDAKDITLYDPTPTPVPTDLQVGDKVKIINTGASTSNGGHTAYGLGWTREILNIYTGRAYPYQVGVKGQGTTGFYKASALQKL